MKEFNYSNIKQAITIIESHKTIVISLQSELSLVNIV